MVAARAAWQVSDRAKAFAEDFARAYLTIVATGQGSAQRGLSRYVAPAVAGDISAQLPAGGGGSSTSVTQTTVAGAAQIGRGREIVTVDVALRAGGHPARRYLAVPVAEGPGGALAVYDLPAFTAAPALADTAASTPDDLTGDGAAQIRRLLDRFIPAYLSGGDLSYFVPPGERVSPVAGDLRFEQVDSVSDLASGRGASRALAVGVTVTDRASGASFPLRYLVDVTRRDRWYVAGVEGQ